MGRLPQQQANLVSAIGRSETLAELGPLVLLWEINCMIMMKKTGSFLRLTINTWLCSFIQIFSFLNHTVSVSTGLFHSHILTIWFHSAENRQLKNLRFWPLPSLTTLVVKAPPSGDYYEIPVITISHVSHLFSSLLLTDNSIIIYILPQRDI